MSNRVLVAEELAERGLDSMRAAGLDVDVRVGLTPDELLDAVRTVLAGGNSVTTHIAATAPRIAGVSGEILGLTHRQADVLRLLIQGKPNKLICRDLNLSEGTVKVHVSAILRALNVHSRAQAIVELARRGIAVQAFARH